MKKITLLTAILIASISFAQVPSYVPTNGLVGWWPFNGNANDESGNGNNGTVNGGVLISDRLNNINSAYSLSAFTDCITASNIQPQFNNFNITVSTWIKFPNQFNYSSLALVKNGTAYSNGFDLAVDQNDAAYGANNYIIVFLVGNGGSIVINTNQSELGLWAHVVATYNGNEIKIYLNGILKNTQLYNGSMNSPNGNILIGKWDNFAAPTVSTHFIDDVAIWNRALTQQEITNLYNTYNLPVELTQFSASCSENTTTINWQTASENNSAYFEVLQSRDGEVWTSKTTTPAAGNSTSTIDYSFTDNTEASLVYYKLKQVDKDGQFKEYGPISADCKDNNQLTIFPNPTTGEITLRGLEQFSNVSSLSINDINGTVVKKLDPTTTLFNVETLQAGVYFLTITAENKQEVVKIIKE